RAAALRLVQSQAALGAAGDAALDRIMAVLADDDCGVPAGRQAGRSVGLGRALSDLRGRNGGAVVDGTGRCAAAWTGRENGSSRYRALMSQPPALIPMTSTAAQITALTRQPQNRPRNELACASTAHGPIHITL